MDRELAGRVARGLIGGSCALDQALAKAVQEGSTLAELPAYRRATGLIMGGAYWVLAPVWQEYPELDPAQGNDPLGLGLAALPEFITPVTFRALVEAFREKLTATAPIVREALPVDARPGFDRRIHDVLDDVGRAEQLIAQAAASPDTP